MRRLITLAAFLTIAYPLARADEKTDAAKKLNGTYTAVAVHVAGKPDEKKRDSLKAFIVKDGEITIKEEGTKEVESATFNVDPSKKPAHIDILLGKTDKVLGIYETKETDKGLELTITFSLTPKAERPKDFKAEGQEDVLIKLIRKSEK
jgi:uncharacterized protein (TIGR03067 family)